MKIAVTLYPDDYDSFDFSTLRPGHTLAMMYAHQHSFLDGSYGIRMENMDHVKVSTHRIAVLQGDTPIRS